MKISNVWFCESFTILAFPTNLIWEITTSLFTFSEI